MRRKRPAVLTRSEFFLSSLTAAVLPDGAGTIDASIHYAVARKKVRLVPSCTFEMGKVLSINHLAVFPSERRQNVKNWETTMALILGHLRCPSAPTSGLN